MKQAINTQTQAEYDALMRWYEEKGIRWLTAAATQHNYWPTYGIGTAVLEDRDATITWESLWYYKGQGYEIIPFTQFAKENGIEL